ncbi:ribose-5-phosphate isomerase RpiA [Breznakiellaceae bacterium SP9]
MNQAEMKEQVGKQAVEALVHSGMKLGLGTGSTAMPAVRHIGLLLQQGALHDIRAVPTSFQTAIECEKWGIPVYSLNSREINGSLDLTIDGADEVDASKFCIKGGGGALLLEKIVAHASKAYVLVVDETKLVDQLAFKFPLPIEVVPEARVPVTQELESKGLEVVLRAAVRKAGPVITEHGNLLLDVRFTKAFDPRLMETELNTIAGIVENGLFTRINPFVFIGYANGNVEQRH